MQDISRVTGNPQKFTIRGEEITFTEASIETLGRIQAEALKAKRRGIVEKVTQLQDVLPPDYFQQKLDAAMAEASGVAYVSDAEFEAWMRTLEGGVTFMHTLLTAQFPDKHYTREEVAKAVAVTAEVVKVIDEASGASAEGNETGPTS